jgi:hypothetical protein
MADANQHQDHSTEAKRLLNEAPALHVAVGIKDLHAIFIPAIEGSSPRELPQDDAGQDQQNRDDRHDTAPSDDYLSSFCADDKAAHLDRRAPGRGADRRDAPSRVHGMVSARCRSAWRAGLRNEAKKGRAEALPLLI